MNKEVERKEEILHYKRTWFWRGTFDQKNAVQKLLERIYVLEDAVEKLTKQQEQ